ncbi:hypothetical protein GCM10022254_38800 [Actinomadura meridiana]|uniref:SCP domain-containing protein n=1 Tax=Actinomadura meridiana TaxID=559626 RepID=A0ABP8C633_9ACTN
MTGIVVAVTASVLALGTGVAIDRLLLPGSEQTSASGPEARSSEATPPGPQTETSTRTGTGTEDGDTPAASGTPKATDAPPPSLKPMRAPGKTPEKPSETEKPSTTSGGASGDDEPSGGSGGSSSTEAAVVSLTNSERAKAGCKPLRVDERLATAARRHSADMAAKNYFDHTSRNGDSPWKRMEDAGYTSPGAENIAKGYATAAAVMKGWMDSPGHRANILNCGLRAIGVGRAAGSGGPLWTQDFGWK